VWTLPNILTLTRIVLAPVIALLPFIEGYWPKVIAFVAFLAAAASDIADGYLARSRKQISEIGILLDPIADKLLLIATLVPIFWLTRHPAILYGIPWWGSLPLWVAVLLVGREVLMTVFRFEARKLGVFIASTIAWFAWKDLLVEMRWTGRLRDFWDEFHGAVVAVTLLVAVVLTAYSLAVYLYRYRALFRGTER
jgi:CDP-diacylglycerol--glycerol-3-phosphate 3-phosphatidyltransferase